MLKKIIPFLALPILLAVIISLLFLAVSLIPQSAIQQNAARSAKQLLLQSQWPTVINTGEKSYMLDNYTDSQIIMQSYNLTIQNPKSIFSNPKHISQREPDNMAVALSEVVEGGATNETSYIYYWMGFRAFVRPMLLFGSYFDIRKVVAVLFWVLLSTALVSVTKKAGAGTAICLGASVALVNPAIASQSLQFSSLFLLTALFLIYLCYFKKENTPLGLVFCGFGVLTQIFDFYTIPITTFGLPILVWWFLEQNRSAKEKWVIGGKSLLGWVWGYGFSWLLKLLFATCFTGINAFKEGFSSFAGRTGIVVVESLKDKYDVIKAWRTAWTTVFQGNFGKLVLALMALLVIAVAIVIWRKKGYKGLLERSFPVVVAALPILWYAIAAQPTVIHAWFQYRALTVMFFGVFLFGCHNFHFLQKNKTKQTR